MANLNTRLAALETEHKKRLSHGSPESRAVYLMVREWFHANECNQDCIPPDSFTARQRDILQAFKNIIDAV